MSGHNKWSQIKHKKGITDAKKSQLFSKLAKFLTVEAKIAKGNASSPNLRAAIEKARKANMPLDNIERAIKKASDTGAQMESITYEAYGPGGAGIIIETLTDSKNRTAQDVKHILSKNEASLAGIGAVKWAFSSSAGQAEKWMPTTTVSLEDEDLEKLEKLVDELEANDDVQEVFTNAE